MSSYGGIVGGGHLPCWALSLLVLGESGWQMHHICERDKTICSGDHKVCLDLYLGALSGTYMWH